MLSYNKDSFRRTKASNLIKIMKKSDDLNEFIAILPLMAIGVFLLLPLPLKGESEPGPSSKYRRPAAEISVDDAKAPLRRYGIAQRHPGVGEKQGSGMVVFGLPGNVIDAAEMTEGRDEEEKVEGVMLGDVNASGAVDLEDVRLIHGFLKGEKSFAEDEKQKADVDRDGEITKYDALLVLKRVGGEIADFVRLGDVDMDGRLSNLDTAKMIRHIQGLKVLNELEAHLADVDRDGEVTRLDVKMIVEDRIALIQKLPADGFAEDVNREDEATKHVEGEPSEPVRQPGEQGSAVEENVTIEELRSQGRLRVVVKEERNDSGQIQLVAKFEVKDEGSYTTVKEFEIRDFGPPQVERRPGGGQISRMDLETPQGEKITFSFMERRDALHAGYTSEKQVFSELFGPLLQKTNYGFAHEGFKKLSERWVTVPETLSKSDAGGLVQLCRWNYDPAGRPVGSEIFRYTEEGPMIYLCQPDAENTSLVEISKGEKKITLDEGLRDVSLRWEKGSGLLTGLDAVLERVVNVRINRTGVKIRRV